MLKKYVVIGAILAAFLPSYSRADETGRAIINELSGFGTSQNVLEKRNLDDFLKTAPKNDSRIKLALEGVSSDIAAKYSHVEVYGCNLSYCEDIRDGEEAYRKQIAKNAFMKAGRELFKKQIKAVTENVQVKNENTLGTFRGGFLYGGWAGVSVNAGNFNAKCKAGDDLICKVGYTIHLKFLE